MAELWFSCSCPDQNRPCYPLYTVLFSQNQSNGIVGMEKCDAWKAVVNEAEQDAMPAKHANVRVIPSNEKTQWNSMEFESSLICKDNNG
jgi:hypothetical protein